ncbi:hypothetical protein vBAmePR8F_gp03 [Alteromonas phage vB_AmeP_R8W]|uniref:Uncharacterized protein n=1 Tax=Alteromonas phage vB_AmeP_R8W TaxID=2774152 RepID=A0A8E4W6F3_9CAUD|nr:hypothetical protein vBAmePR8F_gp03 [Alteromonas phage vB_AmeP_R8W]
MNKLKLALKELILILAIMPAFVYSLCVMLQLVQADYELYIQESYCVQGLVKSGVERINIATDNGKCWFELNGYGE